MEVITAIIQVMGAIFATGFVVYASILIRRALRDHREGKVPEQLRSFILASLATYSTLLILAVWVIWLLPVQTG